MDEVRKDVFARMIAERQRIAERYRSEGAGRGGTDPRRAAARPAADPVRGLPQAQELRGKADAEATEIYAEAYGRDADFYRFMKTMETYKTTIDPETILMLSTDGEYLRYLGSMK